MAVFGAFVHEAYVRVVVLHHGTASTRRRYASTLHVAYRGAHMNKFNLDTLLDKALDSLEGSSLVDRAKAAASELLTEEFKPQASAAAPAADLSHLEDVIGFWRLFDLQVWAAAAWPAAAHALRTRCNLLTRCRRSCVCTCVAQGKKEELVGLRAALHAPAGADEQGCAIRCTLCHVRHAACVH